MNAKMPIDLSFTLINGGSFHSSDYLKKLLALTKVNESFLVEVTEVQGTGVCMHTAGKHYIRITKESTDAPHTHTD